MDGHPRHTGQLRQDLSDLHRRTGGKVEDLAGCATDDLTGWTERVGEDKKHYDGMLEAFKISAADAEDLIMRARLSAGWVTEEDLKKPEVPAEEQAAAQPA